MSRMGASSYEHGDGGGAYGDYEHGVSAAEKKRLKRNEDARLRRNGGVRYDPKKYAHLGKSTNIRSPLLKNLEKTNGREFMAPKRKKAARKVKRK